MKSVIVYGPQGCGKTRNAEKIRSHFGLKYILDGFTPGDQAPREDTLILTSAIDRAPDSLSSRLFQFFSFSALPRSIRE
jgi:hypothetical protein